MDPPEDYVETLSSAVTSTAPHKRGSANSGSGSGSGSGSFERESESINSNTPSIGRSVKTQQ
jgi:hypothetical protein